MGGAWVGVRVRGCSRGLGRQDAEETKSLQTDRQGSWDSAVARGEEGVTQEGVSEVPQAPQAKTVANGFRGLSQWETRDFRGKASRRHQDFCILPAPLSRLIPKPPGRGPAEQGCDTAARVSYCNCFHILLAVLYKPEKRNKGE